MLASTQDYKIALMIGADSFRTLENVEVVSNPAYPDEPWYSTGGLAIVFKIKLNGKAYALKCFHKDSADRQYRLEKIVEYIRNNPSPYWVGFQYLENELWVETNGEGRGYPVVLMEWIEGHTLDNFLAEMCAIDEENIAESTHKRMILKGLYLNFVHLAKWLYNTPAAHGDLKHDNILVDEFGQLKLIDYDGMYIPEFSGLKATELGSPCYQHPYRTQEWFDELLDQFSIKVLHITLYALSIKPDLFKDFYNGDGILFKDTDFKNLAQSEIVTLLKSIEDKNLDRYIEEDLTFSDIFKKVTFNHSFIKELEQERHQQHQNTLYIVEDLIKNYPKWKPYYHRLKNSRIILGYKLLTGLMNYTNFNYHSYRKEFYWTNDWLDLYADLWNWTRLSTSSELPWSIEFIEKYSNKWDWGELSLNSNLPWSIEFIEKYSDKWNWFRLSKNLGLPWSIEFIEKYSKKWNWSNLSENPGLPWSIGFVDMYSDKWDWYYLSRNSGLPWSIEFIKKYSNQWIWYWLSRNSRLPWSIEFIDRFSYAWNWYFLSKTSGLPWSIEFIERYSNRWDWRHLSENSGLPWSIEFIEKYSNKWDWAELSRNSGLPWSTEFIEKYSNKWNWSLLSENSGLPWSIESIEKYSKKWNWSNLSENPGLPWSTEFIERYSDKWDWSNLSKNPGLPWNSELINNYSNKWNWYCLSRNSGLPWSIEFIEKYSNNWSWSHLSEQSCLPWSIELTEKYLDKLDWSGLSRNSELPWSIEFIEKYLSKWDWYELSTGKSGLRSNIEFIEKYFK